MDFLGEYNNLLRNIPLKNIRLFSGIFYPRKTELTAKLQFTVYIYLKLTIIILRKIVFDIMC